MQVKARTTRAGGYQAEPANGRIEI